MYNLISIAMFAFIGFAPLATSAPTRMGMNEVTAAAAPVMPAPAAVAWNSESDAFARSNSYIIETALAQALSDRRSTIIKRSHNGGNEGAPQLDLNVVFRGLFDNIVDYVIESTPLNEIVHGNYDLLYDLFLAKIDEIFTNMATPDASTTPAAPETNGTSVGASPKDSAPTGASTKDNAPTDASAEAIASTDISVEDENDYSQEDKDNQNSDEYNGADEEENANEE
jgi:hypothetical protein